MGDVCRFSPTLINITIYLSVFFLVFGCVLASLKEGLYVLMSIRPSSVRKNHERTGLPLPLTLVISPGATVSRGHGFGLGPRLK